MFVYIVKRGRAKLARCTASAFAYLNGRFHFHIFRVLGGWSRRIVLTVRILGGLW
jgi:hypothetical protein